MIRLSLRGIDRVQIKISRIQRNLADLSLPLLQSAVILRDSAEHRIDEQGPGWPPTWRSIHRGAHIGIDTGHMRQSIGISQPTSQANATRIIIGSNAYYAKWFQKGSGIYAGHSAWVVNNSFGRKGFKTHHLGQKPRPFLFIAKTDLEKIRAIFKRHMRGD